MALYGNTVEQKIWNFCKAMGMTDYGAAGTMANLFAESALKPKNLQQTYESSLGYTDDTYTQAVDDGTYTNFINDRAGYGLAQWTHPTRKRKLYQFKVAQNVSIGDLEMQLMFLKKELSESFKSVLNVLMNATSVLEASNAMLLEFERPADQSVGVQNRRASYGQVYYDKYANTVLHDSTNTEDKNMNEKELRQKVVSIATSYVGCKESDGTHRQIIDIYNSKKPLPVNYKVTYTDAWCATYVTAVGIVAELSDIIFRECGCGRMIDLYKKAGRWVEDDSYTPQEGDVIFYDWQDNGVGDNVGISDHVGIVVSVNGTTMKIVEGNITDSVGYRTLKINGKYIRGYGIPDYASKANSVSTPEDDKDTEDVIKPIEPTESEITEQKYHIGDIVKFIGNSHFVSSNSVVVKSCVAGTAKVTSYSKNAKHPYHLVAEKGKGSTVYGWVNESDIEGKITSTGGSGTGSNNTVNPNTKVEYAQSFDKKIKGTYRTTSGLNMRSGAGTDKTILTVIPKNGKVNCYGYYTTINNTRWYYVTHKNKKGIVFTGFVSSKYLK